MRNILLPPLMKELMFYFSYFLDSLPALSAYNPNPSSPSSNLSSSLTLVHPPSCWVSTHSPSEHPRILEIKWALLPPPDWNYSAFDSKKLVSHGRASYFGEIQFALTMGRREASKKGAHGACGLTPPMSDSYRPFQSMTPHQKSDRREEWGISWGQKT